MSDGGRQLLVVLETQVGPGQFNYTVQVSNRDDLMLGVGTICRGLAVDYYTSDEAVRRAATALLVAIAGVGNVT